MNKGKNKRRQLEVFDETHKIILSVDSQEEVDMIYWLNEAINLNIINEFHYQPASYQLSDPVKYIDITGKSKTLYREHSYTTDFCIEFNPNKQLALAKEFKISYDQLSSNNCSVFIDVKGTFNRNARSFSTDRKWLWQKFNVYIYELVPQNFFKVFGVPKKSYLSNKKKQPRKCFLGLKSLTNIFKN